MTPTRRESENNRPDRPSAEPESVAGGDSEAPADGHPAADPSAEGADKSADSAGEALVVPDGSVVIRDSGFGADPPRGSTVVGESTLGGADPSEDPPGEAEPGGQPRGEEQPGGQPRGEEELGGQPRGGGGAATGSRG